MNNWRSLLFLSGHSGSWVTPSAPQENDEYQYHQTSNISRTKSRNLILSRLDLQLSVFAQSIEARCQVENEDIVGAAPTPTTSEWSNILLPSEVRLILEV